MGDPETDDAALQAAIQGAEFTGDWSAVISLYIAAARKGAEDEAFNLTQAYIYALEAGDRRTVSLKARLVALRAEKPDP